MSPENAPTPPREPAPEPTRTAQDGRRLGHLPSLDDYDERGRWSWDRR